ncbi:MarR family winged helix-turn-helix transcriptional regulator [Microbacterium elymi]|uniref:MarR family transcriptional regulator n=1 Tax=Microbacterium elymi TaxID=2909587 RepID=A0ABY5NMF5_9MICO|nr:MULTISPECIES: MarR family transcriptional regulator [Microbacterium]UUT36325.1 MarR family transcriptional regulator [Microbacterium elymi]
MTSADSREDAAEATVTASRALLGIIARSMVPALEQVSLPQFRVLVVLASAGPLRMGALAERLGVNVSTFSRMADRLVLGGRVRREGNPDSRREVILALTDSGHELVRSVTDQRRTLIAEVLARMDPGDRDTLNDSLRAFDRAAGEPAVADLLILGL